MQRATLSRMPLRAALVLALAVAGAGIAPAPEPTLHACAGAGQWFPADPTELRDTVARYLDAARPPELDGNLRALVVPHAGYPYSGPTAAVAYRLLRGRSFHRVIILAISHRYPIDGASVLDVAGYQTPLGTVEVDREAVHALLKNNAFTTVEAAHRSEHSDENQLPFLQCALGDFQLVSILVGDNGVGDPRVSERKFAALAAALRPWIDARTLLVVSSDFTHYGQPYGYTPFRRNTKENLRALDGEAASYLIARDAGGFEQYLQRTQATICGRAPLALLLRLLPPDTRGAFLHYDRSGDGAAASLPSVGYMALAFVSDASPPAPPDWIRPAGARVQLSTPECRTLLRLAHDSIAARWDASHRLHGSDYELTPRLMTGQGAFVTLMIDGRLRGCIGSWNGETPLYARVAQMARSAAFSDPRFPPLTATELGRIKIEISALTSPDGKVGTTPFAKLESVDQIRLGRDGLKITLGARSGLLLPQVPTEFGWNRDEFLAHLCEKAGLPGNAWKEAEVTRFCAQVFSE